MFNALGNQLYSIAYSELDVVAVFICFVILYDSIRNDNNRYDARCFFSIVVTSIILVIFDILSWLIMDQVLKVAPVFHHVVLFFYFSCQALLTSELLVHAFRYFDVNSKGVYITVLTVPLLSTIGLLVGNYWGNFLYVLDENANYYRASFSWLISVIAMIPLLTGAIWSSVIWIKNGKETSYAIKRLWLNFVITIVCSALTAMAMEISPWPLVALSLLFLSRSIQGKETRKLSSLAFTDALTHIKNSTSYKIATAELDQRAAAGEVHYAVVILDTNFLKDINDMFGHEVGDQMLVKSTRFICSIFAHSPVFRIGGDEFAVILENDDYENRSMLFAQFDEGMRSVCVSVGEDKAIPLSIARGFAIYRKDEAEDFATVFARADRRMYSFKTDMKKSARFEDNIIFNENKDN